jgi:hypothetical protein
MPERAAVAPAPTGGMHGEVLRRDEAPPGRVGHHRQRPDRANDPVPINGDQHRPVILPCRDPLAEEPEAVCGKVPRETGESARGGTLI